MYSTIAFTSYKSLVCVVRNKEKGDDGMTTLTLNDIENRVKKTQTSTKTLLRELLKI